MQYHLNSPVNQLTKHDLLLVLRAMLDGHQAILKKLKATTVGLDKTFVTKEGRVKVWVTSRLECNDIAGEVLTQEEQTVCRIFDTVCLLDQRNGRLLTDFAEYASTAMGRNGQWKFSYLRALIRSYSECLRSKMPRHLTGN
jgi:hypothetical protein